jgi:hypothetical protein
VTTDHISPAGSIKLESPAGRYLVEHGVERADFNSYGSRRGNHEVMVRGTFANVRLRNLLVPGSEGTWTVHLPSGDETTIFEAAERYLAEGTPTIVLAGKEYGSGSSRDWAAKGPSLLGVRAAIAESYERIHRSNLLMMGILPLQFLPGESRESLGLTGREVFSITGLEHGEAREVTVRADETEFRAILRLDTPRERSTSARAASSRTYCGSCWRRRRRVVRVRCQVPNPVKGDVRRPEPIHPQAGSRVSERRREDGASVLRPDPPRPPRGRTRRSAGVRHPRYDRRARGSRRRGGTPAPGDPAVARKLVHTRVEGRRRDARLDRIADDMSERQRNCSSVCWRTAPNRFSKTCAERRQRRSETEPHTDG